MNKFDKVIEVSLALGALGMLLMGLIFMFTTDSELWTVPFAGGLLTTMAWLWFGSEHRTKA